MFNTPFSILAFGIGLQEMIVLGVIGVLLFGKRLPEVGRQLGKGLSEFKRGMQGIESEISSVMDTSSYSSHAMYDEIEDDYQEPTAPKFEPPTEAPKAESDQ